MRVRLGFRARAASATLASAVLLGSTAGAALADVHPFGGTTSSSCLNWGSSGYRQSVMTADGTYVSWYQWNNMTFTLLMNACGASAPYGDYKVSSTKKISTTFWINVKDISSCTGGIPTNFSCTASGTTTTASYNTPSVTKVDKQVLTVQQLWFIDAPSGHNGNMRIEGSNTIAGNVDYRTYTNSWGK